MIVWFHLGKRDLDLVRRQRKAGLWSTLQGIPKTFVVQLCEVMHSSLHCSLFISFACCISSLILPPHVYVQHDNGEKLDDISNKHGNVCTAISGCVGCQ